MFEIPILKTLALGPLTIQVWGLFVGLGMLLAYGLARPRFRRHNISSKHLDNLFLLLVISSLIGARLLWVLIEYDFYFKQPIEILKLWNGGLAFTGGFFAALASLFWYIKRHSISFWKVTDALAVPLAGGLFLGRFGCLLTGLHPGILSTVGVVINVNGEPRLAWAFFAIVNWLIAFIFLSYIEKKPLKTSTLSQITLLWWGFWRLSGDFIRSNDVSLGGDPTYAGLTPTQYLALLVIVVVSVRLFKKSPIHES
ncbi:MAG: prolipoprotein diacylglyceryl transferase [Candidatus Peregrinibacteria bacterium]|nr:prolipoprotein diacylglyceryl transferase [Candidatus Peregrinibacteria bacterium]